VGKQRATLTIALLAIRKQHVAGSIATNGRMFSITYYWAFSRLSHLSRTFASKQSAFATFVESAV
jgi:hypothetical protein